MHSKVLSYGTGACSKAIAYALDDKNEKQVEVLRGNPEQVAVVADALGFKHKYTSQVLAWGADDSPTDEQVSEVVDAFISHSNAGLEHDRYACTAIAHKHDDGSVDIHVIQARVELSTGNSMNIAPPGHIEYFDPLRDFFNEKYQWNSPDIENHPAQARAIVPESGWNENRNKLKTEVNNFITDGIEIGLINNRADVVQALEGAGVEVTKQAAGFITIKTEDMLKGMRLKGECFNESFTVDQDIAREATAEQGRSRRLDGQTSNDFRKQVERLARERAEYNAERYRPDEQRHEIRNGERLENNERSQQRIEQSAKLDAAEMVASNDISVNSLGDYLHEQLGIRSMANESSQEGSNQNIGARNEGKNSTKLNSSDRELRRSDMRENKSESSGVSGRLENRGERKVAREILQRKQEQANDTIRNGAIKSLESSINSAERTDDSFERASEQARCNNQSFERAVSRLDEELQRSSEIIERGVEVVRHNNNDELEKFKTDINFVEYLHKQGFQLDPKASTAASAKMTNGSETLVVVTKENGHGVFCNVHDNTDAGTIIDYIKNRQGLNIGEIRRELRPELNIAEAGEQNKISFSFKKPVKSSVDLMSMGQEYAGTRMLGARGCEYLQSTRKISSETLNDPRFEPKIRVDTMGNAIFPHVAKAGVVGFEKKNNNFTGFSKGGEKGVWCSSNFMNAERVVFTESAIDALSHAQIKRTDSKTAYVSVGGSMSPAQEKLVEHLSKGFKERGTELVSATDNDRGGEELTAKLSRLTGQDLKREAPEANDWNKELQNQSQIEERRQQLAMKMKGPSLSM